MWTVPGFGVFGLYGSPSVSISLCPNNHVGLTRDLGEDKIES